MSVIALAIACFPVAAQAACSACSQYTEAPPTATGSGGTPTHHEKQPTAKISNGGGDGQGSSAGSSPGSKAPAGSEGGSSSSGGANSPSNNGDRDANGQGSRGGSSNGEGQPQTVANPQPASQSSGGGDSSPLVPILIGAAVLAALSIAAFLYRQRRHPGTPSGSPAPKAN